MSNSSNDETRPAALSDTAAQPVQPRPPDQSPLPEKLLDELTPQRDILRRKGCLGVSILTVWLWFLLGAVILVAIAGVSAYSGYLSGNEMRISAQGTQTAGFWYAQFKLAVEDINNGRFALANRRLDEFRNVDPAQRTLTVEVINELTRQFDLALQDLGASRYASARLRLEWIIEWDPSFPGVIEKLSDAMYFSGVTATPTTAPTPTLLPVTPTPDTRNIEARFSDAQALLNGGNWSAAIDTLLELRKSDPSFHAVDIDGMLYVALRNRGVDKIFGKNTTDPSIGSVDLEGGMYDLALAERFGVLDTEARQYRRWAQWYVTGASFWEVDWARVIDYFEDLILEAPYLYDRSGYVAVARYRDALVSYGDWLIQRSEWCLAQDQYRRASDITLQYNLSSLGHVEPTATYASEQCSSPEEGASTQSPPVETPPAGEVTPTAEPPTPEPPTPEPTNTPEPTAYP